MSAGSDPVIAEILASTKLSRQAKKRLVQVRRAELGLRTGLRVVGEDERAPRRRWWRSGR